MILKTAEFNDPTPAGRKRLLASYCGGERRGGVSRWEKMMSFSECAGVLLVAFWLVIASEVNALAGGIALSVGFYLLLRRSNE